MTGIGTGRTTRFGFATGTRGADCEKPWSAGRTVCGALTTAGRRAGAVVIRAFGWMGAPDFRVADCWRAGFVCLGLNRALGAGLEAGGVGAAGISRPPGPIGTSRAGVWTGSA
ncbi:MAG TPA: hypothetical protein VIK18_09230, partial [Pirellulales bacterium]